jgi:hypothetical protein
MGAMRHDRDCPSTKPKRASSSRNARLTGFVRSSSIGREGATIGFAGFCGHDVKRAMIGAEFEEPVWVSAHRHRDFVVLREDGRTDCPLGWRQKENFAACPLPSDLI